MKKIIAICLVLIMTVCLSSAVLADSFYESPTGKLAPEVVSFTPADEDCTGWLVVTPYGEREGLPEALKNLFESAYNQIKNTSDVTALNLDLAKLVADKNLKSENLAVSDLFDIHVAGCDFHDGHVDFDIVLDAEMLSHFVALLHMNKDGQWELVKDAKVVSNGDHLAFSVESFSPFAIVVDTEAGNADVTTSDDAPGADTETGTGAVDSAPQTGKSDARMRIYVAVMVASVIVLGVIVAKSRRERA